MPYWGQLVGEGRPQLSNIGIVRGIVRGARLLRLRALRTESVTPRGTLKGGRSLDTTFTAVEAASLRNVAGSYFGITSVAEKMWFKRRARCKFRAWSNWARPSALAPCAQSAARSFYWQQVLAANIHRPKWCSPYRHIRRPSLRATGEPGSESQLPLTRQKVGVPATGPGAGQFATIAPNTPVVWCTPPAL